MERQDFKVENRGKEEERQGAEEEGKKEEDTPPRGRRAKKKQQRRHDLWYDKSEQTKTSKPKKGRHEELYHTTRSRDTFKFQPAPNTGLGLEHNHQSWRPDHAPTIRREARTEMRDLETRIPARSHRDGRPGSKGQKTTQVRRIRSLQGTRCDQREQCK